MTSGTGANGWATPMIAGTQPNQTVTAPLKTPPALVKSMGVIVGAIAVCLLLRAAGDVRRANSAHRRLGARAPCVTAGIARFGFDVTGGANGFDFNVFNGCDHTDRSIHTTECGTSNRKNDHRFPVGMRVALALNTPCRRHDRRVPGVSGHRHH